jgi:hypothetical protein
VNVERYLDLLLSTDKTRFKYRSPSWNINPFSCNNAISDSTLNPGTEDIFAAMSTTRRGLFKNASI